MQKLDEFVKASGTTMYFPKIVVTQEEMERMWYNSQIDPYWLRLVVANYDAFDALTAQPRPRNVKVQRYQQMVEDTARHIEHLKADVIAFGKGDLDIIDFVVKYGIGHKKCRAFVKDVFANAGVLFDVDSYWKQHKKHAQKNTTVSLYGVAHTALRPEVQAKRIATNQRVYGADNPMQVPEIKEKLRARVRAEHGVDYTFQKRSVIPAWHKKVFDCLTSDTMWTDILKEICDDANIPYKPSMFEMTLPLSRRDFVISELSNAHVENLLRLWKTKTGMVMKFPENALFRLPFAFSKTWLKHYEMLGLLDVPECYYRTGSSVYEKSMEHFLDYLGVFYVRNHKKALDGLEMDFYIPEKHIGIEINPNVSHNSNLYALTPTRSMFDSHKEANYHYNKYQKAKEVGITLIQLFGNDIEPSTFAHITSKRLQSLLCGYNQVYHARKVQIRELSSEVERKQARAFLDRYHSQGSSRANHYWVLEQNGEWLGVASFTKHKEDRCIELKRLCFKSGVQVIGGLSKLIAHYFRNHPECISIYSYSDNSMGNGMAYEKAGAVFVRETGPALKFISPKDGRDSYSWQIATSWGANQGVVGEDANEKGIARPETSDDINRYIELSLTHRLDGGEGYDRIYTPGSKLWKFERKE